MSETRTRGPRPLADRTYFSGMISHDSGISGIGFGGDTLAEAVADAIRQGLHFSLVCGYVGVRASAVVEQCRACHGSGRARAARGSRFVRCKACRGEGERPALDGFPIRLPRDAENVHADLVRAVRITDPAERVGS